MRSTVSAPAPARENGFVLVGVLAMISLLMGLGIGLHVATLQDTRLRGALQRTSRGFYAAEAGANVGVALFRNKFLDWSVPQGGDFATKNVTVGGRRVEYAMKGVTGYPQIVTIPAGQPFGGASAREFRYTARAIAHGPEDDAEAAVGVEFRVHYIPLFQFLAFYENDLEILPGPEMHLHGPIHTNGDLYLNSESTMWIEDLPPVQPTVRVTAGGMIFRGRKDRTACNGTVIVDKLEDVDNDGNLDPWTLPCAGEQAAGQLSPWLGSVVRDIDNISLPNPDALQRGSGDFWYAADLRIALDVTTPDAQGHFPIVVLDANEAIDVDQTARLAAFMNANPGRVFYNDVPGQQVRQVDCGTPPAGSYCHQGSYASPFVANGLGMYPCTPEEPGCMTTPDTCAAGVVCFNAAYRAANGNRRGGFYDNREGQWVYMLNVNVAALLAWNMAQGVDNQLFDPADATEGGVVLFLTVLGPNAEGVPVPRYGVRAFGSPALSFPAGLTDPTGLTLVSDQVFYLEGDYNAGAPGNPKQPAAIMADTLNVLSAGWQVTAGCHNDCRSGQTLGNRPGANTTVNAAFLAGVDITTVGSYNGGLENYPRFHEGWGGATLTYRGSFVSLGTPRHATGQWGQGNVYNPPGRNWDFDTDFVEVANLPPLTPRFVHVREAFFAESFK